MNKKILYTLSTAFLLSGLTACNNNADEGAMGTNGARQVGYYSDENHANENATGNAILPDRDNDGPVTEMLDRAGDNNNNNRGNNTRNVNNTGNMNNNTRNVNNNNGNNHDTNYRNAGNIGTRDDGFIDHQNDGGPNRGESEFTDNDSLTGVCYGCYGAPNTLQEFGDNTGVNNPTRPAAEDRGLKRDNRFARSDYNYHGQMAGRDNNTRASYNNNYNGRLAEEISNRVQQVINVEDVRTIINGDDILVAVDTNDRNNNTVEQQVRDAIRSVAAGKDVRVVTDEGIFTRARNIDNELRDGGPTEDLDTDVRDMFREIGDEVEDAVRTPFRDTK
ncbi:YhcN/YlaJ family sporulation lipoprotein [Bacillus sp. AK128]